MLDAARLAIDLGLAVLAWLVQLVIYPSFRAVEATRFPAWHAGYTRRISWVVVPLMLAQAGLTLAGTWSSRAPFDVASLALVVGCWLATFAAAVPAHDRLRRVGRDDAAIDRLLRANAWRTAGWSGVAVLGWVRVLTGGNGP